MPKVVERKKAAATGKPASAPKAKKASAVKGKAVAKPKEAVKPKKTSAVKGKAVAKPREAVKARRNKRSGTTIENILAATEEIVLQSGAERISILDVCREAEISRGTFYRYFSSQEELLDAFSRHTRDRFHTSLADAVSAHVDPDERLQAVLSFVEHFLENTRARRLLIVAPDYALRWFQRIFHDSVIRFQDVLDVTFDAWEKKIGVSLDRELICELLVRYILSDVLVPSGPERHTLPRRIERMMSMLLSGRIARR